MEASFARLRALACLPQRQSGLLLDGYPASVKEAAVLAACGGERLPKGFAVMARYAAGAKALDGTGLQPCRDWVKECLYGNFISWLVVVLSSSV